MVQSESCKENGDNMRKMMLMKKIFKMFNRTYKSAGMIMLTGLFLTACGTTPSTEPPVMEPTVIAETAAEESTPKTEATEETTAAILTDETEAGAGSENEASNEKPGSAAVPNPITVVDSSSEFAKIGLKLELPQNEQWCRDPVYTFIDGKVAQIQFHDEIVGSDAVARAAKVEEGDISGVYYVFDEKKEQTWTTELSDGAKVDIRIQITIDGADIHGVLATWSQGGFNYTLWEDDAWENPESVAKLAMDIMRASEVDAK